MSALQFMWSKFDWSQPEACQEVQGTLHTHRAHLHTHIHKANTQQATELILDAFAHFVQVIK